MGEPHESYSSKSEQPTQVKVKRKTVGITLPQNLLEKARSHKLNLPRITAEALTSIVAYLEQTNTQGSFLGEGFHERRFYEPGGFEPAT